ncbi:MAG TPA: VIT domain-containing protein [Anaerolineaceae bacterium]|nr:VIT domain-containing protein [Anaerolineaceae bacterium]HPN51253.1 VIT domain-containing protein [Anaerolineaceae bacterium]
MKHKLAWILFTVLLLVCFFTDVAHADGIIIVDPPICEHDSCPLPISQLNIRYHHVTVTIENQVAVTHVDQVFYNPNSWTVEGTYIFPIPVDAVVTNFVLWIDGQPVEGQVLSANEARARYEEIVRSMRDPALLEYMGRGAVQARIFPILSGGERRIELEYSQALTAENGLLRYTYPLNTEKFSKLPLESVSIDLNITSPESIRAAYSTSHNVTIEKTGDHQLSASYEENNVLPDTDFTFYYSIGETQAFHLLTYRDPSDPTDPEGFFLLLMAPKPGAASEALPKDLILVLDRSGSMEGEKFLQAQAALNYILAHLNEGDRFNVITFSSDLETYASGLRSMDEAAQASKWVDRLAPMGSTDINRALLEAMGMADKERPTYVIFLTDGLPTRGVTDPQQILNNAANSAPKNVRLFAFGVGYDVDTFLLDTLAQEHSGKSTYVGPGEALDEILSAFYATISTPVMTGLNLEFNRINVYDLYPNPLPDLFIGSQIAVVGRYRDGGVGSIILSGEVEGSRQQFTYIEQKFSTDSRAANPTLTALPRLWATRKIGYLLNQIRLKGPDQEMIDQIVKLSIRYGIVTPYTSYLVTEDMTLGTEAQDKLSQEAYNQAAAAPTAPSSGEDAVRKAAEQGAMQEAEAPSTLSGEAASRVRIIGSRTFVLKDGLWIDTTYDPQKQTPQKVNFLSDDYFKLAQTSPDLAAALALGDRVLVVVGSDAYEVVTDGASSGPLTISTPEPTPTGRPIPTPITGDPIPTREGTQTSSQPTPEATRAAGPSPLGCPGALIPVALIGLAPVLLRRRK